MSFIKRKSAEAFQKLGSNVSLARILARKIPREDFLRDLKEAWTPIVSKNANTDAEVRRSWERVRESGYESVFKTVGVTDDDLRLIIEEIKSEKSTPVQAEVTPGRNDLCTCGSGNKFKRCCGG